MSGAEGWSSAFVAGQWTHSQRVTLPALFTAALLFLLSSASFAARPFPEEVRITAYARVQGERLELLVRAPAASIRDVQFPLRQETAYVDMRQANSMAGGLARYWFADRFPAFQQGTVVAMPQVIQARLSVESVPEFGSYYDALTHLRAPPVADTVNATVDQLWLDMEFSYPLANRSVDIQIQPRVADLGVHVTTALSYATPQGREGVFSFEGDPGRFDLNPRGSDAARGFLVRGAKSAAAATDYLLFLICVILPLRRTADVAGAVAVFAAGLTLTLTASWLKLSPDTLWFPPLVSTSAAALILLTALANIAGPPLARRRALLALGGGLVFGFRFWFDLAPKLQFGGAHPRISAIAFNVGVVAATLTLVAVLVPLLYGLFHFTRQFRAELIVASALAADTAWHWLSERGAVLGKYPVSLPAFDAAFFSMALGWLAILTLLGGMVWFVELWLSRRTLSEERPLD